MSKLKQKSDQNFKSAKLLIQTSYYSASVHCAYYSAFQLMIYAIRNFENNQYTTDEGIGYHKWLYNIIFTQIALIDVHSARNFANEFGYMKRMRVAADYKNRLITEQEAEKMLSLSERIIKILNQKFEV